MAINGAPSVRLCRFCWVVTQPYRSSAPRGLFAHFLGASPLGVRAHASIVAFEISPPTIIMMLISRQTAQRISSTARLDIQTQMVSIMVQSECRQVRGGLISVRG